MIEKECSWGITMKHSRMQILHFAAGETPLSFRLVKPRTLPDAVSTGMGRLFSWRRGLELVSVVILCVTFANASLAEPPEHADPALAPWFNSLAAPDGTACCAMADCRPATSRLTADGYEVYIDRTWVTVSWDRVLDKTKNPTGQAIVCMAPRTKIILCFVRPPDT